MVYNAVVTYLYTSIYSKNNNLDLLFVLGYSCSRILICRIDTGSSKFFTKMEVDLQIKKYIERALEEQSFRICEITLTGPSEISDGYASNITFATVLVATKENVTETIEVVVKSSKKGFVQTNRNIYERETYFYKTILPEFTRFQKQNNIKNIFNSVPKCYKTISDGSMEVIVMENLKKNGYDLYDRKKPLDIHHLKLVLREYGKFHAISFALRSKSKDNFEKLSSNFEDVTLDTFKESFRKAVNHYFGRICDILKSMGYTKLHEMCNTLLQKGVAVAVIDILKSVEPESAILHGDCWNNNFLYKYETEDHKNPSKVAILDWQLSRLHSPVLDLSYFIYSTCSEDQLKHFEELLDVYYTSFSTTLADFGCDSESLFPYSSLQEHWKKYSLFGFIISTTFLHLFLCEKKQAPNDCKDGHDFAEQVADVQTRDAPEYKKKLLAIVNHYYKYTSTS